MLRRSSLLRDHVAIALVFLVAITTASPDDLWSVHIDDDPAPPVADSPPFSRNASRDRALLKYQIPGIIGGYVGFVLIITFAILTCGRRMRRAAQSSRGTLSMEMVRPAHKSLDPSPISPAQSFKKRWGNLRNASIDGVKRGPSSTKSPQVHTAATFDSKVLEADRARQQEEMQKLYAAVMAQDVAAPKTLTAREQEVNPALSPNQPHTSEPLSSIATVQTSQTYDEKHPPELAHLGDPVQALYPPYAPMPSDPASRTTSTVPTTTSALSYDSRAPLFAHANLSSSPPYDHGHFRQDSRETPARMLRRSSLRISTIRNTPESFQQSTGQTQSPADFSASPTSPVQTRRPTTPYPRGFVPHIDANDDDDNTNFTPTSATNISHSYPYGSSPRAIPSSAPQRLSPPPSRRPPNTLDSAAARQHATASSSLRSLPLRTLSPASTASPNPTPTPTRTTFLSPRQDRLAHFHTHLSPSQQPAGPSSAAARAATAVANAPSFARMVAAGLTTPYSAYMPFSPVTPVTPGLRSREQRRWEEREEERRVPCREDDAVAPEKEMWGDAW